jgi:hypothetical protein
MAEIFNPPKFQPMFRLFKQSPSQPPQYGNGMWPALAVAIDFIAILVGIVLLLSLLLVAWTVVSFVHSPA